MELFADPHLTKLATSNNRRIMCGGLQWDIYIHPNQGESSCEFALSVFPVKTSPNDAIPDNYRLRYTVTAAVNARRAVRDRDCHDRDDHKAALLDTEWSREIEDIVYDAQPADSHSAALNGAGHLPRDATTTAPQIDWRSTMERLTFSTQDLRASNVDDEDYFDLEVSIRTEFIRKQNKRSQYHGVVGAILLQSEAKITAQAQQIDALDRKKDAFVQSLQSQLREANELNRGMVAQMERLSLCQTDMQREMAEMKLETQKLGSREKHSAVEKEKAINRLQEQAVADKDEIQRLMLQVTKLKQQLASAAQHAQLEQLLQTQMHVQAQAMAQAQQPQPMPPQNQVFRQQQQRQMHAQQQQQAAAAAQFVAAQPQTMSIPPMPMPQTQSLHSAIPPATETPNYAAFNASVVPMATSTASPQRVEASPSAYQPRVISQPAYDSYEPMKPPMPAMPAVPAMPPSLEAEQKDPRDAPSPTFQFTPPIGADTFTSTLPALEKSASKAEREEESISPAKGASEEVQTPDASFLTASQTQIISNGSATETPASEIIISDEIDFSVEEQIFTHRPVRGWRWDKPQQKWRGRGKGKLSLYYHREQGMAKLLFVDEKHDKTRLTQWIDGDTRCELVVDNEMRVLDTEVEWVGADYTMCSNPDTPDPMVGKWKLQFTDDAAQASAFREIFNQHIDAYHGGGGTAPTGDAEDANDDNLSTQPFTFSTTDEPKIDSFGPSSGIDFSAGLSDATASNWATSFGNAQNLQTDADDSKDSNSNSFGNINWSFGNDKPENATANATAVTNTGTAAAPAKTSEKKPEVGGDNEDNGTYTLKPIVQLEEVEVGTGHEDETLMAKVSYLKLYRFGKDVSGCPCWKNRGTRSTVYFYAHKETNKVRLVSREEVTNKLRMNQLVPREDNANFTLKQARVYSWNAYDVTIAAEEEDDAAGMCAWSIKFETEDAAEDFARHFRDAMQRNSAAQNQNSEVERDDTPELLDSLDTEKEQETEVVEKMEEKAETPEAERYAGWTEEDIHADKMRREKAKKDAKAAALFSSGDGGQQTVSWNMGAFDASATNGAEEQVTNLFANVDFEAQRGVDLEAEAVLNKIAVDPTISFGIGSAAAETNADADANADGNGASGLGFGNFSFDANKADDAPATNAWGVSAAAETTDAKPETSVWGAIGGGFSDVAVTDGFANATWGSGGDSGGFGSFGDAAANFNVEAIQSSAKVTEVTATPATTANAAAGDDEDNGTYTLKPIVQLEEVNVNSGHEEERELDGFEVAKLYRWGKDVTSDLTWKQRASNTKLEFWQHNVSGRIRIVCRENVTNKLRLNQIVDTKVLGAVSKMSAKQASWVARDVTIEAEDEDESQGVCKFACKFIDEETADKFVKMFTSSGENNATVG